MLHEFITSNHDELVARTRAKVEMRPPASGSNAILDNGVPLFLTQLAATLRLENTLEQFPPNLIGSTAARHGEELLASGYTVSQVVHGYVCVRPSPARGREKASISPEDFHTLNRCLTTIAERSPNTGGCTGGDRARGLTSGELRPEPEIRSTSAAVDARRSGRVGI